MAKGSRKKRRAAGGEAPQPPPLTEHDTPPEQVWRHTRPQVGRVIATVLTAALAGAAGYYVLRPEAPEPAEAPPRSETSETRIPAGRDIGYVDSTACAGCHQEIAETYRQTGMGRSFARATPENMIEDFSGETVFYHEPSGRYYEMIERDGKYFQKRYQLDSRRQPFNVFEQEIHYVMGSGNHARSYLHRHANGKITEMPLGWYAGDGGFWAMSPGYDNPRHRGFLREIHFDCMGCHNGYPTMAPGEDCRGCDPRFHGEIPSGIDCQRCHGPGEAHIQAVAAGEDAGRIREAIVNPARLSVERQIETCMQCHLETTTRRLPYSVPRFDKGAFAYVPGEPLSEHVLHFDHEPGKGPEDKFEIAHAAYRLRKSACFQQTAGLPAGDALTCTTCHDPHHALRGDAARAHYVGVCKSCHEPQLRELAVAGAHPSAENCLPCHMPKRRTGDVVNVVMTDHYIQRRKPRRDLLAPLAEDRETPATAYHGEVVLYYPEKLPSTPENELYLAVAQVAEQSNLVNGISRLERLIRDHQPQQAQFYFELAEAHWHNGGQEEAIEWYEQAVQRDPEHQIALRNYGVALSLTGRLEKAEEVLTRAAGHSPQDAQALSNLGDVLLKLGRAKQAEETLRRAVAADPALPEAHNNLAAALAQLREHRGAIAAVREAIRIRPDYPAAHNNLANYLAEQGETTEAERHYRIVLDLDPEYAEAAYNYANLLAGANRLVEAENWLRRALEAEPEFARAHNNLGNLLAMQGKMREAVRQFRRAVEADPALAEPYFNLGTALASQGEFAAAIDHFRAALERRPDYPQAQLNLAYVLAETGAAAEARRLFEQVVASGDPVLSERARQALEQSAAP